MFKFLREHVINYYNSKNIKDAALIKCGHENVPDKDYMLKYFSTDLKWSLYQSGKLTREKAVEIATGRARKANAKKTNDCLAKIDAAQNAENVDCITIVVEWRKSSMWGYNPHATVRAAGIITEGTASGCGYDKESTAVAEAFNKNPSILKELYILKQNNLIARIYDKSECSCTGISNESVCGYGAGYAVLPYFEGGVGVGCFWNILKKCGFKTISTYGKNSTHYVLIREEKK